MKMLKYVALLMSICLIGMLFSCSGSNDGKPVLMVSIPPQKYLLEHIVGDKFEVKSLLTSSSNPETYEPSVSDFRNIAEGKAYFAMGHLAFESALLSKIKENNPDLPIVDCSEGVVLLYGTHDNCGHQDHRGHSHGLPDPHTWSSVKNSIVIATNMRDAVAEIDPGYRQLYETNFNRFYQRLDSLNGIITDKLMPMRGSAFMVWHPSLSYFANDYGLVQIPIGQEGKESSVVGTQRQIEVARGHGAKLFFSQREFDSRHASLINEQIGAEVVMINPMNENWEEEINLVANSLYDNR